MILIYYLFASFVALGLGLRGNEDEYTRVYILIPSLDNFFSGTYPVISEKGFVFSLISSFFKTLGFNSQSIFIFFSATGVFIHAYFYRKYTKYYCLAFLIYISHELLHKEWIGLRMALASALLLPMVYWVYEGKKKTFLLFVLISSLIQYVAVLSIALVFLNRRFNPIKLVVLLVLSIVVLKYHVVYNLVWYFDSLSYLPSIVSSYLRADSYVYNVGLEHPKTIQQIVTVLVLLSLFGYREIQVSKYYNLLFNSYYLSTILQITFSELALFAFRFGGHFYTVEPILLTFIVLSFKQKKSVANFIALAALGLAYVNYVVLEKISPYKFLVDYPF